MFYSPSTAAEKLDVSPSTVRRWASVFGPHLSNYARPEAGQRRAFTDDDIATFAVVKDLLAAGLSEHQVSAQLGARKAPQKPTPTPPAIDEAPADEAPPSQPPPADEPPSAQLVPVQVAQALVMVAGQQAQLADQAARLTQQEAVLHSQADRIAALERALDESRRVADEARDEARKIADELARRRFRWPWQGKD